MSLWTRLGSSKGWRNASDYPWVRSKLSRILQLARGKDVLDCGCVGARFEHAALEYEANTSATPHVQIAQVAQSCLGVDIWEEEIEKRKRAGFDVLTVDVERMKLDRTFDVIVAGDLIEHLANPGAFLDRAREHLREDGLLCVVTPNAFSANTVLKSLLGISAQVNPEHTCWYDPTTLEQMLRRHGFRPIEWYWQDYVRNPVTAALMRYRPNLAAHIICIAQREQAGNGPG